MVNEKRKKTLDSRTAAAIKLSIEIGRKIQQDLPQITDDYRNLTSRREIVERYKICERYGVNIRIAKPSVSYAIRGYHGKENVGKHKIERYDGLISDKEELRRIFLALREKGLEYMINGRIGIHAQTDEEKKRFSSIGGINNATNHGFSSWSREELEEAHKCSQLKSYWNKRRYGGHFRVNNSLIAERLNELFHNGKSVRKEYGVKIKLCKYRRRLKK